MSALRFATPAQLLMCLVLFFLPWVEIQCPAIDLGDLQFKMPANGDVEKQPAKKPEKYTAFLTQTGLQAATGKYTFADSSVQQMMDQAKKMAPPGAKKEDEIKAAPLLFLVPIAALAGMVVGLAMPASGAKKGILIVCCALVIATAGGQAAMGFPVEKDIKKQQEEKGKQGAPPGLEGDAFKTVYKVPFFLTLVFALGGLVTAAIEPATSAKKRRRYRSRDEEDDPMALDDDDAGRPGGGRTRGRRQVDDDNPFADEEPG
jgi:hypothetical protein